ncbi:cell division protein FtsA [Haematospirillum jordaniae]|uniref:cell division protein FtsA n=1 Tax=Haematospirillum jordaniae TaxID=1549855 RepID=UPI0014330BE6|nr:cell division protein FtsA [Haematospirillum jordaniae]NKD85234.1 cell division protein FtsA [Haematospirillum jordaniae]
MARNRQRNDPVTALDVGTTKVACFVATADENGDLRVLGVGHHRSRGMRNGQVADMAQLEESVRAAVDAAEQTAGVRVGDICINVTGGGLHCRNVDAEVSVAGHAIRDNDVRRILEQGHQFLLAEGGDRELIHCIPTGYTIDGTDGIVDPRGMYGDRLGVRIHMVAAGGGALRNLANVIDRCHLRIESRTASAHASAVACTVDDEKEMGVTVIDMGGGTTSISVFLDGHPVFADVVPVGGNHVTNDIARGLSTPAGMAERLKTVWGTVHSAPADARELLKVPQVGEDEDAGAQEIPRSELVRIIRPRIEETFELVRARLSTAGMLHAAGRRVVLTGGASQLQGLREMAELVLDKQVRLGRPRRIRGVPENALGPAFSACAGLLRYAIRDQAFRTTPADADMAGLVERNARPSRGIGRVLGWLKENI